MQINPESPVLSQTQLLYMCLFQHIQTKLRFTDRSCCFLIMLLAENRKIGKLQTRDWMSSSSLPPLAPWSPLRNKSYLSPLHTLANTVVASRGLHLFLKCDLSPSPSNLHGSLKHVLSVHSWGPLRSGKDVPESNGPGPWSGPNGPFPQSAFVPPMCFNTQKYNHEFL